MRKILLSSVFLVTGILTATGQFVPNSSQSFQLMQAYNPAFTGFEGFTSVKLGYRSQWSSFPGAPQFINAVVGTRIHNATDVVHNALRVGAPVKTDEIPKAKRIIHGLGASLVHVSNGSQGLIENMSMGLNYALHYPLKEGAFVAFGLTGNYESIRVRWDKLEDDPLASQGGGPYAKINIRAGLAFYTPKFYVHAAYYPLYSKTNADNLTDVGFDYKGTAGLGLRFRASPSVELRPSVLALIDMKDNIDIDYSVKFYYNEKAWGGVSYRDNGFVALILGFEFNSLVGLSYSYEMSTGGLQGFNNGSNEFILGLKLANFRKLTPAIW